MIEAILWIVLVGLVVFLILGGIFMAIPYIHKKTLWCVCKFKLYFASKPDYESSPYYKMYPKASACSTSGQYTTIDDPIIKKIADELNGQMSILTPRAKAEALLAFVQQTKRYQYDKDNYGKNEQWVLPINTLRRRYADCEDVALLYAALCYHCGLDVKVVCMTGHLAAAVYTGDKIGFGHTIDGKKYLYAEPTGAFPILGVHLYYGKEMYNYCSPTEPTDWFKRILEYKEQW